MDFLKEMKLEGVWDEFQFYKRLNINSEYELSVQAGGYSLL